MKSVWVGPEPLYGAAAPLRIHHSFPHMSSTYYLELCIKYSVYITGDLAALWPVSPGACPVHTDYIAESDCNVRRESVGRGRKGVSGGTWGLWNSGGGGLAETWYSNSIVINGNSKIDQ